MDRRIGIGGEAARDFRASRPTAEEIHVRINARHASRVAAGSIEAETKGSGKKVGFYSPDAVKERTIRHQQNSGVNGLPRAAQEIYYADAWQWARFGVDESRDGRVANFAERFAPQQPEVTDPHNAFTKSGIREGGTPVYIPRSINS